MTQLQLQSEIEGLRTGTHALEYRRMDDEKTMAYVNFPQRRQVDTVIVATGHIADAVQIVLSYSGGVDKWITVCFLLR